MDVLSTVLRDVKLDSAIYFNAEFSEPWCLLTPESGAIAPTLAPGGGHVITFHLLCEGRAYAGVDGAEHVALSPGDIVTFPHGHGHVLGGGECSAQMDAGALLQGVLDRGLELLRAGGGGASCRFICGFLACDPQLSGSFLAGLPPLIKVSIRDDPSGQWLENSLKYSVVEAAHGQAGAAAMLTKLSEAVFAETLRRYSRALPEQETGWLAGVRDPEVGRALTLLHANHARPWTVGELAREVGLSRTVLAERFRHFLGESPMAYRTRWRLGLGARALADTNRSVAQVALEVGYESEAAFNRAFKREYGLPPARYRREKASPSAAQRSVPVAAPAGTPSSR
jgi:AraC-like DNA-binding protein